MSSTASKIISLSLIESFHSISKAGSWLERRLVHTREAENWFHVIPTLSAKATDYQPHSYPRQVHSATRRIHRPAPVIYGSSSTFSVIVPPFTERVRVQGA
jgi:hypothetical protein